MEKLEDIYYFIFSEWYWSFLFFFLFFSTLYFGGTFIASVILRSLRSKGKVHAIYQNLHKGQVSHEISRSMVSILIFSIQAIPLPWLIHNGYFHIRFHHAWSCLWEIPVMFLWNEIHFYAVHWLLHRKWLMKHVHYVHHQSKEPTVYSVFSFHWVEAFLLGTVVFFPLAVHDFHIFSVLSLPVMSIILNLIGHCNHEKETTADIEDVSRLTFRHTMHHKWSQGNFGFMLPYLDQLFKTSLPKNKQ